MTLDFNLTSINISQASINGSIPIVTISNNQIEVEIADLLFQVEFFFECITDPPLFADIGYASIQIKGLYLAMELNTTLSLDKVLSVDMEWLTLDFNQTGPLLNIDGLNDFGIVLNNTINTFAAIVRNRLSSIINAQYATPAVNSAVNKILALIP